MNTAPDMIHALDMREELAGAIRKTSDPAESLTRGVTWPHARAIAEALIKDGLVDLENLSGRTLSAKDDDLLIE